MFIPEMNTFIFGYSISQSFYMRKKNIASPRQPGHRGEGTVVEGALNMSRAHRLLLSGTLAELGGGALESRTGLGHQHEDRQRGLWVAE